MKSKMKRRMLAIVLCMVIVLSNSSFIFASSGTEEPAAVAQEGDPQNVQEAQTEAAVQDTPAVLSETTPEATPEATPEPTQVPEVTAAPTEAPQTTAEPTQAPEVTAAPEATPAPTETPAVTAEPTQAPEITPTPTPEVTAAPEATPVPTEAPVTYNEAVELRHEFKDENGNVTATVTAQIPAGAFQADASELTMEVTVPDQATTEHVKKLMEESLPEHYMLGDTVLYDIRFKVNGTETESQQPIVITFENQNGITVKDVKKAVVFQLDPADPAVEGDKDELVTITQRNDMIESLQNSGQSTDNVDDYDLSEITLKEDGTSNKIQMEGRTSTIYGCYAYYEPVQVLTYEDDQVTVTVSAAENGVIPANAELKVVPITEDKETEDQYKDVEKKLQEKAEEEEYEITGFLAYDITFVDPEGNETEPSGEVKVSIDYNEAAIPESVSEEDAQNAEVTVLHLEEDEKGEVKEVVDMAQNEQVDVLATTEENKVEKAEVRTESFSMFVIQWESGHSIKVYYVNENGTPIQGKQIEEVKKAYGEAAILADYSNIDGNYTYLGAHLNSKDGKVVAAVKYQNRDQKWYYGETVENGSYDWEEWNVKSGQAREIYLVYGSEVRVHFVSGKDGSELQEPVNVSDFLDNRVIQSTEELAPDFEGYNFVKTVIADEYDDCEGKDNDYGDRWALRLRENNGSYQYNRARIDTADNYKWSTIDKDVYFIYKENDMQIATADSTKAGIKLELFNYDNSISTESSNAGFPFYNGKSNSVDGHGGTNSGGEVKNTLSSNGYPISLNKKELDFLFGKNAMSANYLFTYDEQTKCYEYNSAENHAWYDKDEEKFYVYNYTISPAGRTNYHDFNVGNFFPFNDVINPTENTLNFIQYGQENRSNVDYWFGMTMGVTFYQPKDGILEDKSEMKFEFAGDDDVFVYLDGVLILDLGGIHASEAGTINFSTGIINENGVSYTIYERYAESGLFTEEQLNEMFKTVTIDEKKYKIFADYKSVDMDFFYLERGAGASNCHIKFNMPPIPDDTIIVGKEITNSNADVYSDVEFSFKLEVKKEDQNSFTTVSGTEVDVYDRNGKYLRKCSVDDDGIFKLRHGERAYFEGYPVTTKYKVTEVGVSSNEYDEVVIAGVHVTETNSDGETTTKVDYQTDELFIKDIPMVVFQNRITTYNKNELRITKELIGDNSDTTYQFQVYLGTETEEGGEPYTGIYYVNQVPLSAVNGIIQLKAGQTAGITDIPSGTSFKVVEVGLDNGIYNEPVYDITTETADIISIIGAAEGKILFNKDAKVTVTNSLKASEDKPMIKVQKTFSGLSKDEIDKLTDFSITVKDLSNNGIAILKLGNGENQSLKEGVTIIGPKELGSGTEITYEWEIHNVDAGKYQVSESGADSLESYKLESITVNGNKLENVSETVTTQEPGFDVTRIDEISSQCETEYDFEDVNLIIISLVGNDGKEYLVWSADTLSAGERESLTNAVGNNSDNTIGQFKNPLVNADMNKIVFFSTREIIQNGFYYRGEISVDQDKHLLFNGGPKQWNQIWLGSYKRSGAIDAEIEIVNTYTPDTMDVDLKKFKTDFETPLTGAKFSLYTGEMDTDLNKIKWEQNPMVNKSEIPVSNSENAIELIGLQSGYYKLVETEAPDGYLKLAEPIIFKVDIRSNCVTLIDESGNSISSTMWNVNGNCIKIANNILYDLPSAGGSGIFWYLISGTAFLMAASLILYRMKRKEVLGK